MDLSKYKLRDAGGFPYIVLDEKDSNETSYGVIIYPAADSFALSRGEETITFSVPYIHGTAARLCEIYKDVFSFLKFAAAIKRRTPTDDELANRILSSLSPGLIGDLARVEGELFNSGRVVFGGTEAHKTITIRTKTVGGYARV